MAWVLAVLGTVAFPAGIAGAVMAGFELQQARRRFAPAPIEERAEGAIRASFFTATANLTILWNAWPLLRSLVHW
jgi:hypothetical protein